MSHSQLIALVQSAIKVIYNILIMTRCQSRFVCAESH